MTQLAIEPIPNRKSQNTSEQVKNQLTPPAVSTDAFEAVLTAKANRPMIGLDKVDFDAFDDQTNENGQNSPAKREGRSETGRWARAVVKALTTAGGFTKTAGKKGKPVSPVSFGWGMAHEFDETFIHLTAPNGLQVFVKIGNSLTKGKTLNILVQYTGEPPKPGYSRPFIGSNEYLKEDLTPAQAGRTDRALCCAADPETGR